MKKFLIATTIILITAILVSGTLCITAYLNRYKDWQEIDVREVGTFKIPPDWAYHRDRNILYITDKSVETPTQKNAYIVGTVKTCWTDMWACQVFDDSAKYVKSGAGTVFSNNARVIREDYIIQENLCTKININMAALREEAIDMLVWDESIEYELAEKIAKSFSMHRDDE